MIVWKEKFRAFGIHFFLTLIVAALAGALIFFVWYPDPFDAMVGGTKLFLLVAGCDLALGPLISLVIYNSRKSRKELVTDYVIVGVVQLAAFVYGVHAVSQARPAFVVFVGDRLEVAAAGEILQQDYAEARDERFKKAPLSGPDFVATHVKPEERNDALEGGLAGRDIGVRPKFYVEYESKLAELKQKLEPLSKLEARHSESKPLIERALAKLGKPADRYGWLPVKHAKGFWTVLVDVESGKPAEYIPIDPY